MAGRIYFDNAATTPIDPRVLAAMQPYLGNVWGNPASLHTEGREARVAVDLAREQVARLLGVRPGEIVFTSSGTEADALALRGSLLASGLRGTHLIASAVEHPAVLAGCQRLEQEGVTLTLLPVDHEGIVDPDSLAQTLRRDTRLVSVMAANAHEEMSSEAARLVRIRDHIIDSVLATLPNAYLIGDRFRRLPGHICFGFSGAEGEAIRLLLELDQQGIAVSSGSACSGRHAGEPSHVLEAMGFDPFRARGSLRITLGRFNTFAEADRLSDALPAAVRSLRTITSMASSV